MTMCIDKVYRCYEVYPLYISNTCTGAVLGMPEKRERERDRERERERESERKRERD